MCCRWWSATTAAPQARSTSAACSTSSQQDGWHVIHDASFDYGNVDHIVLGAQGVFTIETKSRQGDIRVRTIHGGILRQAQEQRETLERITGEQVEPLVVFSRAWVDKPLARRRGVRVDPRAHAAGLSQTPRRRRSRPSRSSRLTCSVVAALAESESQPDRLLGWPPPSRSRS